MADELLRFGITVDGQEATVELRRFLQEVSRIAATSGQAQRGVAGLDRGIDSLDDGFKSLERSLDKTEKELSQVERETRKLTDANRQGLSFVDKLSIRITGLNQAYAILDRTVGRVVRSAFGFASSVVETGAQFEAFRTRLVSLTGDARAAASEFERMRQVAERTPFNLGAVVEAGITLRSFGDSNRQTLKAVADLAAFMGTDIVTAAQAYGRAFAAGAGAADILRERGVLTRVSLVALRKGIDDITKVSLPEFRALLRETLEGEGIRGQAERLAETLNGIFSNIQDKAESFRSRIGEAGLFDTVKAEAQEFLDIIQQMDDSGALDRLASALSDTLSTAIRATVGEFNTFLKQLDPAVVEGMIRGLGRMAEELAGLAAFARRAAVNILNLVGAFQQMAEQARLLPDLPGLAGLGANGSPEGIASRIATAARDAGISKEPGESLTDFVQRIRRTSERGTSEEQSTLTDAELKTLDASLKDVEEQSTLTEEQLRELDRTLGGVGKTSTTTSGQVKQAAQAFVGPPDSLFASARKAEEGLSKLSRSIADEMEALDDPTAKVRQHFRDMREEIVALGSTAGRDVGPLLSAVDELEKRTLAAQTTSKEGWVDVFDVATDALGTFLDAFARGTIEFDQIGQSIKASLVKSFVEAFRDGFKAKLGFEGDFKVNLVGFLADIGRILTGGTAANGQGGIAGIIGSLTTNLLGGQGAGGGGGGGGGVGGIIQSVVGGLFGGVGGIASGLGGLFTGQGFGGFGGIVGGFANGALGLPGLSGLLGGAAGAAGLGGAAFAPGTVLAVNGGLLTIGAGGSAVFSAAPAFVGPLLPGGVVSAGGAGGVGGAAAGGLAGAAIAGGIVAAVVGAVINSLGFSNALDQGNGAIFDTAANRISLSGTPPFVAGPLARSKGASTRLSLLLSDPFAQQIAAAYPTFRSGVTGDIFRATFPGVSDILDELYPDPNTFLLETIAEFLVKRRIPGARRFNARVQGGNFRTNSRGFAGLRDVSRDGLSEEAVAFGAIVAGSPGTGKNVGFAAQIANAAQRSGLDIERAVRSLVRSFEAMRRINQVFEGGTIAAEEYAKAVQGVVEIFFDIPSDLAARVRDVLIENGGTATAQEVRRFLRRDVRPAREATAQALAQGPDGLAEAFASPVIERFTSKLIETVIRQAGPGLAVPLFDIRTGFREARKTRSPGGKEVTPEEVAAILSQTSTDLKLAFEDLRDASVILETATRAGLIFTAELKLASGDFMGAFSSIEGVLSHVTEIIQSIRDLRDTVGIRVDALLAGNDPLFAAELAAERANEREARTRAVIGERIPLPSGVSIEDVITTFLETPGGLFEFLRDQQALASAGGLDPASVLAGLPPDLVGAFNFSNLDPAQQLEIAQEFADVRLATLEAELSLARQQAEFFERTRDVFQGLSEEIDILRRGPRGSRARTRFETDLATLKDPALIAAARAGDVDALAKFASLAPTLLNLGASLFGESSGQFVGLLDFLEPLLEEFGITATDKAEAARAAEEALTTALTDFQTFIAPFLDALETQAQQDLATELQNIAKLLDFESPIYGILKSIAIKFEATIPEEPNPNDAAERRAFGGHVFPGGSYLVGEHGPELFMPPKFGKIIPFGNLSQIPWDIYRGWQPIVPPPPRLSPAEWDIHQGINRGGGTVAVSIPISVAGTGSATEVADRVADAIRIQHPRLVEELRRQGLR